MIAHRWIYFVLLWTIYLFPFSAFAQEENLAPPLPAALKSYATQTSLTDKTLSAIPQGSQTKAFFDGAAIPTYISKKIPNNLVVSGTNGEIIALELEPRKEMSINSIDAKELRLKVRELASQLFSQLAVNKALSKKTAFITSFVNLDNFDKSSNFGKYFSEQLYYELNQRNVPVREYRLDTSIAIKEEGEFILSRNLEKISLPANSFLVVGTYYYDAHAIFINARLLDPSTGTVLQTASLLLNNNATTRKMLAKKGGKINNAAIKVRSLQETIAPTVLSPFDRGEDVH